MADLQNGGMQTDGGRMLLAAGGAALLGAAGYAWWLEEARRREIAARPHDAAPGRSARRRSFGDRHVVGRTVTIGKPRAEIWAFWRDIANWPRFMENLRDARDLGEGRFVWRLAGPVGRDVEIPARITEERPETQLSWASDPQADVAASGRVAFRDAPGGRGTEVEAIIAYRAPAGALGDAVAALYAVDPATQGRRELKRLKMLLETGEIATSRMTRA